MKIKIENIILQTLNIAPQVPNSHLIKIVNKKWNLYN